jgi:hypothetical protein
MHLAYPPPCAGERRPNVVVRLLRFALGAHCGVSGTFEPPHSPATLVYAEGVIAFRVAAGLSVAATRSRQIQG